MNTSKTLNKLLLPLLLLTTMACANQITSSQLRDTSASNLNLTADIFVLPQNQTAEAIVNLQTREDRLTVVFDEGESLNLRSESDSGEFSVSANLSLDNFLILESDERYRGRVDEIDAYYTYTLVYRDRDGEISSISMLDPGVPSLELAENRASYAPGASVDLRWNSDEIDDLYVTIDHSGRHRNVIMDSIAVENDGEFRYTLPHDLSDGLYRIALQRRQRYNGPHDFAGVDAVLHSQSEVIIEVVTRR
jgi:hypothetical protein